MGWNFENNKPIYLQILEKFKMEIIGGKYASGEKLPSVREIAMEAAVNPNTVQKALSELETTGVVYNQRNSGRFVTEDAELIEALRYKMAREVTIEYVDNLKKLGYTGNEAEQLFKRAFYDGGEK